ncbi:MAG: AraC family transcriptional regulator [Bacteroidales bacterium]|nr:AraC family transcriptional regulator [Bacteroidales bacterium]
MREILQNIGLAEIKRVLPSGEDIHLGDDFFIIDIRDASDQEFLRYPFRTDAFLAIFCEKGGFDLEINLMKYHIEDSSLTVCIPGNILKIEPAPGSDSILPGRFVAFAVSRRFISDLKFDFTRLFDSRLKFFYNPRIRLGRKELYFCSHYFHLIKEVIGSDIQGKNEALEPLVESLLYVLSGMIMSNPQRDGEGLRTPQTRLNMLFEKFMSLVSEFHTSERGMAFYSERLGLTPKYLSRLIKQVSGRSAPEWIDSFVIQEAKSMLKYTNDSIKEIVYKLNFVNASVFYKFFKAQTGMTPSAYRNG